MRTLGVPSLVPTVLGSESREGASEEVQDGTSGCGRERQRQRQSLCVHMCTQVYEAQRTPSGVIMHLVKHLCAYFVCGYVCVCTSRHMCEGKGQLCRNWNRFSPFIMWTELQS